MSGVYATAWTLRHNVFRRNKSVNNDRWNWFIEVISWRNITCNRCFGNFEYLVTFILMTISKQSHWYFNTNNIKKHKMKPIYITRERKHQTTHQTCARGPLISIIRRNTSNYQIYLGKAKKKMQIKSYFPYCTRSSRRTPIILTYGTSRSLISRITVAWIVCWILQAVTHSFDTR